MWIDRREGPALRAARPARFVNGSIPLLDHHHHQHQQQQQQQQPHQPHGQHGQHRQPLPASPIIVEDQEGLSAPADEDPSEEEDVKEEALAAVRREVGAAECCAQLITGQTLAGLLERREATLAGLAKSELAALRVWTCGCSTSRKGFASTPGTRSISVSYQTPCSSVSCRICLRLSGVDPVWLCAARVAADPSTCPLRCVCVCVCASGSCLSVGYAGPALYPLNASTRAGCPGPEPFFFNPCGAQTL
eukprot:2708237-Rhodomonas_salina.5